MAGKRSLKTLRIEALPLLNTYIEDCDLYGIFDRFVPSTTGTKVPSAKVLLFVLRNIMLAAFPLYKLGEWARNYPPELLGMTPQEMDALNDDRIGRDLERLFLADRSTMTTVVALWIIERYEIEMATCHNDSTSVSFYGAYKRKAKFKKKPVALLRGFSKNHRPDLKQLVFNLVISGDGAVPIHYRLHDGNVTDDTTHRKTWDTLRNMVGHPDFIYVADSKLCTVKNMAHIDGPGGKFITVLPKTRKEYTEFMQWVQEHPISGRALWYRNPNTANSAKPDHYRGYESSRFVSQEGFRIIWIRSAQKRKLDAEVRNRRIETVWEQLEELSGKLNKYSLKSKKAIRTRVDNIPGEHKMKDCFSCRVKSLRRRFKKKLSRGRPCANSVYKVVTKTHYELEWSVNEDVVEKKANADGFFPLITNIKDLAMKIILKHYKYQPHLEKRHSYLKSVLEVAPVYLKMPERIEALLFLYYLALMIYALMERDMCKAMGKASLKSIPIYPEKRECLRPSAERILATLQNVSKHELWENNSLEDTFFDPLDDLQVRVMRLLRIPMEHYGKQKKNCRDDGLGPVRSEASGLVTG